jgi:ornithine carbamoyltransferase
MLTIREHLGSEKNKRLVFVGDGNNVARSLAAACGRLGMAFTIACPRGYELSEEYVQRLTAECPGLPFEQTDEPTKAVAEADVLYTDVWASMGQEEEAEERRRSFEPFQVNAGLLAEAPDHCVVMHDLPAHRDEEITDEVIEHERSIVFDQAENRMHLYRGLYAELLDL